MRQRFAALCLALLAPACSDLPDEGTKPVALEANLGGTTGLATVNECIPSQATATLYFDGNLGLSAGDYSDRARWDSSDPGIVAVSNGELPAASGGFYAPGVLLPKRTGSVQITAEYLDFRSTLTLEVQPVFLQLEPALTDVAARSEQAFSLELRSASGLLVTAPEGVDWSIDQAVSQASVGDSGLLQANAAADEGFTLRAQPLGCEQSATLALKVSDIDHLELVREQPDAILPVGISDRIEVHAHFAGEQRRSQNLSTQMRYEADDDSVLGLALGGEALQLTALEEGEGGGTAIFEPALGETLQIALPRYRVADLETTGLRLTPDSLRLPYPATGMLQALARYEDGIERPVSRHVSWSSSDASQVSIVATGSDAGEVNCANRDYSGQAYASLAGFNASAAVLCYRNEGP